MRARRPAFVPWLLIALGAACGAPTPPPARTSPPPPPIAAPAAPAASPPAPAAAATPIEFCGLTIEPDETEVGCEQPTVVTMDVAPLARLPKLKKLLLKRIDAPSWTALEGLVELEVLWLKSTNVTDLAFVARMPALRELDLSGADVASIAPLTGHPALQQLYIGQTKVTDLEPVASIPTLTKLDAIWLAPVSWEPLAKTRLVQLDLYRAKLDSLAPIAKIATLRGLGIEETDVTSVAPLVALKELRHIALSAGAFEDLRPLTRMKKLCRLDHGGLPERHSKLLRKHPRICLGGACGQCDW